MPLDSPGLAPEVAAVWAGAVHALRAELCQLYGLADCPAALDREPAALRRGLDQLAALVDDLEWRHRLAPGGLRPVFQACDLAGLLPPLAEEVLGLYPEQLVVVECAPRLPLAWTDPALLREVLALLVRHMARQAGARRAPIRLEAAAPTRPQIVIRGPLRIPVRYRAGVFEPVERLPAPARGLGVGLYVARAVARRLGGDLDLAPAGAEGSALILELPGLPAEVNHV